MVQEARSWLRDNSTLAYFLIAQFIAAGALAASALAYAVKLEGRVHTMEVRGAAYTVARMDEMKLSIARLEQRIDTNEDSIKLIREIMTRELGETTMNEDRKLTQAGANLIQHFEGCLKKDGDHYKAYKCPAGVLTIGWGHTNHHGRKFDASSRWTADDCNGAFLEDMEGFEAAVRRLVKVRLTDNQYDALVSFTYNCGEGNFAKSTLLKRVNAGDHTGAAAEFHRWNKGGGKVLPGLTRRRASESLLYQGIRDANYDGKADPLPPKEPMPQAVDNPEDTP